MSEPLVVGRAYPISAAPPAAQPFLQWMNQGPPRIDKEQKPVPPFIPIGMPPFPTAERHADYVDGITLGVECFMTDPPRPGKIAVLIGGKMFGGVSLEEFDRVAAQLAEIRKAYLGGYKGTPK